MVSIYRFPFRGVVLYRRACSPPSASAPPEARLGSGAFLRCVHHRGACASSPRLSYAGVYPARRRDRHCSRQDTTVPRSPSPARPRPAVCAHRPHHGVDSIRQTLTTAILPWLSVLLLARFASALQAAALVLHALAPCVRAHRPHQSFDPTRRRDPGLVVSIVIDEFRQSAEPCCCTPTTPRCARIAPTTVSIPDAVILALLWASSPAQCNTAARPCSLRALPCREQDLRVPLRLQRRNAALKRRRRRGVECVRERDQRDTL
jgi:hypothetical protein